MTLALSIVVGHWDGDPLIVSGWGLVLVAAVLCAAALLRGKP